MGDVRSYFYLIQLELKDITLDESMVCFVTRGLDSTGIIQDISLPQLGIRNKSPT